MDNKLKKNIVLTGMMGVGKTTIGKSLANRLFSKFIDIDTLIEEKEGRSIKVIFDREGENYFRKLEQDLTLQEIKKRNSVISLGGGAFLNRSIRSVVKEFSISFWLDVNLDILTKRLQNKVNRPLLNKQNLSETINKIYLERKETYNEASFKINCSFLKPEQIVNEILKLYEI